MIGFLSPGIDNAAHIGGLVAGVLTAMLVGVPDKTSKTERTNGIVLTSIYVCFIIYLAFFA
jgi:rhomboid protease GluP